MPRLLIATALLVLMAPPAFARLEIENLEACYGQFGPARKVLDYYPNDTIFFRFTVKGARADPEGNCDAEVTWKILDGSGKELVVMRMPAKGPQPCFGCDHFPVWLSGPVPQAIARGEHTLRVSYKDNLAGEEVSLEKKVRLKDEEFAIVSPAFFRDPGLTTAAPAGGVVGEALFFRLGAIGFDRSQGKIDTEMTAQVFDEDNKPALAKPITVVVANADERAVREATVAGFRGAFQMTRPGEFTLRITVTDRIGKKTTALEMPLKVTAP